MSLFSVCKPFWRSTCVPVCLAFLAWNTYAQRAGTALEGVVTDTSGAIVQGAKITLVSQETSFTRTAGTNDSDAKASAARSSTHPIGRSP